VREKALIVKQQFKLANYAVWAGAIRDFWLLKNIRIREWVPVAADWQLRKKPRR